MDKMLQILNRIGLPFAYDHFAEGELPDPPFICYLTPSSHNFAADGRVYHKSAVFHLELYTDQKNPSLEETVETVLDSNEVFYDKTEVWIGSERLYEVLYTFELEV